MTAPVSLPAEEIAALHRALRDAMDIVVFVPGERAFDVFKRLNDAHAFVTVSMLRKAPPLVAELTPPAEPFREHVIASEVQS